MNPRREEEVDVKADVPARDVRYLGLGLPRCIKCFFP